jgi:hypothetical protein
MQLESRRATLDAGLRFDPNQVLQRAAEMGDLFRPQLELPRRLPRGSAF